MNLFDFLSAADALERWKGSTYEQRLSIIDEAFEELGIGTWGFALPEHFESREVLAMKSDPSTIPNPIGEAVLYVLMTKFE